MLFGEGRCGAFRHRYLEYVQGVADQGVVADETDHLDQAGLAQGGGCLVECRVRKPPGVEELGADPVDKGFVLFHKARGLAATDRLIAVEGTPAFSANGACANHSYCARQNRAVVMIASSESRSGSEVPQRRCSPSFAACS